VAQRTCIGCGTDLSGFNPAVKRCPGCCAGIMRAAGLEPLALPRRPPAVEVPLLAVRREG
jgi:hypothetical protein